MQRLQDVIQRVEEVRNSVGMNKTKFATSVELTPQTYNNFQAAKEAKQTSN